MIGIYKIINPNNKVYIGQSTKIESRIKKYKWMSATAKQPQIHRSILKHGWDNHQWEVIEECSIGELDSKEAFHKQQFINSNGWGKALFCQIWDAVKNRSLEQSVKDKISASKKGEIKSEETKRRMVMGLTRGIHCKPAYQYDLDGKFIREWEFREDAELEYNGKNSNNITSCINNTQKTAYGYQWTGTFSDKIPRLKTRSKPINQYDLDGKFIREWDKASDAERHYNPKSFERNKYGSHNIVAMLAGKQTSAYNYQWRYLHEEPINMSI